MTHFPDPLDTEEAVLAAMEAEALERRLAEAEAETEAREARLAGYPEPTAEALSEAEAEALARRTADGAHRARVLAHRQALLAEAERLAAG